MFVHSLLVSLTCTAIIVFAQIATPVWAQAITFLSLQSGHSTIINAKGLTRVAVGDGRIAGVLTVGTSQLIINAKSSGHTTVTIWTAGGILANYEVTVTEQGGDDLARLLRSAIGDSGVSVASVGKSIIVSGTIVDTTRSTSIAAVIERFRDAAKSAGLGLVNALTASDPFDEIRKDLTRMPGAGSIRVDGDAKGNIIVSGRAPNRAAAQLILERARRLSGANLGADGKVIDRLELAATSQVAVKVYVLEIDQTGLKQLGLRLQGASGDPSSGTVVYSDPQFPIVEKSGLAGMALTIGAFVRTIQLAPTIDAILQAGHATVLSAPVLVTMPGQKATFLAGGEIPYIYSTGLGASSIVFKDYGVRLDITPTILGSGSVETIVAPEVSNLDFSNGIALNGFTVPALKTSRITTDIVTQPGESIVMAGLLQRIEQRNIYKIPGLGNLPILGQLFRSTRYQRSQTDVIFVMTPEIITR